MKISIKKYIKDKKTVWPSVEMTEIMWLYDVKKLLKKALEEQRKQDYEDFCIKQYKHLVDSPIIKDIEVE